MSDLQFDVAILGSGFAGVYAARSLRRQLGAEGAKKVALISEHNYMTFQPMLAEVCGSSISPLHVVNPNRMYCRGVNVLCSTVTAIDLDAGKLTLHAGDCIGTTEVGFKQLVLAMGSVVDVRRVPGMAEHGLLMKTVGDAIALRSALLDRLEEANLTRNEDELRRLLTFVVVGGGYSGVETAGQLMDLFQGVRRFYPALAEVQPRVILIHSGPHLMPTIGEKLGIYSERALRKRGITVLLNSRVQALTSTRVFLTDGTSFESRTVVTTVGNAPHPLIVDLCKKHNLPNQKGRLNTDATLRVTGRENLWAAGDCAAVPYAGGGLCPATAQFALRQGTLIGKNIAAAQKGKPLKSFTFKSQGELASIGHQTAVAEIMGLRFSGFFAWLLWRAIYLNKLPGFDRKIRVLIDWVFDLFFPREISLLRSVPTKVLREMYLEKGDPLGRAGEPLGSLYIVKTGRIDLTDEHGVVRSVGPGDYFGEKALLSDRRWLFNATAGLPTQLIALDGESFLEMAGASQGIHRFFEKTARRFARREELAKRISELPPALLQLEAKELMSVPVVSLKQGMTLGETLALARQRPFASYPLLDNKDRLVGIIEHNDLVEALRNPGTSVSTKIEESGIACVPAAAVHEETPLPDILEQFSRSGSSRLLVFNQAGAVIGMLTLLDIAVRTQAEEVNSNHSQSHTS